MSFWSILFGVIVGLLILMALVVAHEFGHFLMAKRNGVKVKEFGIGFPPRAIAWVKQAVEVTDRKGKKSTKVKWVKVTKKDWQKDQDGLIFSINWLPIGGFCSMDGESDADTRKGTFGAASFWGKTKILFGGVLMNWLVAAVILTVLAFTGMPQFLNNQFYLKNDAEVIGQGVVVANVIENSPADKAGFKSGDKIIRVGETEVFYPATITDYGTEHAGGEGKYIVERDGKETEVLVKKLNDIDSEYILGVEMSYGQAFVRSTWSAPIVGVGTMVQLTGETFRGLGTLVWNLVSGAFSQFSPDNEIRENGKEELALAGDSVSGPVGIIGVIFPQFVDAGAANLAFLAALISVSLACMNVLPIPALDGGRWLLIALYRARGRKLPKETEEKIISRAFMFLLFLIILITILDITKFF